MKQFYASELDLLSENARNEIIKKVVDLKRKSLWSGKERIVDYQRLRVVAHI